MANSINNSINTNANTNIGSKISTGFTGPSQSYYTAMNRFQDILQSKLGVSAASSATSLDPAGAVNIYEGNTANSVEAYFDDVTLLSGASADAINEKLKGTGMEGLGSAFADAEQKYGVNAWFLTSLAIHESAYGTSKIATEKNNLFGFRAYDASPFKSAKTYSSPAESVDSVAKYLSEKYLTPGAVYYSGESVESIGKKYATDTNWANAIKKHMVNLLISE